MLRELYEPDILGASEELFVPGVAAPGKDSLRIAFWSTRDGRGPEERVQDQGIEWRSCPLALSPQVREWIPASLVFDPSQLAREVQIRKSVRGDGRAHV